MPPAHAKLLEALQNATGPTSSNALVDWIHEKYGHGLTREKVSKALNALADQDAVDSLLEDKQAPGRFPKKLWFIPTPTETP